MSEFHPVDVSAIVPICDIYTETAALLERYVQELHTCTDSFELIIVLDGSRPDLRDFLAELAEKEKQLRIIQLAQKFGHAAALSSGLFVCKGDVILTLPAHYQVDVTEIGRFLQQIETCDMVIATRRSREGGASAFKKIRRKAFHWLIGAVSGLSFNDLGCSFRAFRRRVSDEITIYGDQHRFLPLLAARRGFKVNEIEVKHSGNDGYPSGIGPQPYLQRLLDILTIVFLIRFTKKPLRFFGMIGGTTFGLGCCYLAYIVFERLFLGVSLADRPALLLSSLMVVLGLQLLALGLLGELIIFTHARELKEYSIEEIIN